MADMTGLDPGFAAALAGLQAAVSQRGGTLGITSGFRSTAQQSALFNASDKSGKMVAPPGHSNHERGLAVDLSGSLDLAHQLAPLYGLTFPMSYEPWHIEPTWARDPSKAPVTDHPLAGDAAPTSDPGDRLAASLMSLLGGNPTADAFNPISDVQPTDTTAAAAQINGSKQGVKQTGVSGDIKGYATALLNRLGLPVTDENIKFMSAWQRAEGGSADNPFNTTQGAPGATNFNSVGVKRYPSVDVGLEATAKTLTNGRYGNILAALALGNNAKAAASALANSPWGTGSLVEKILG